MNSGVRWRTLPSETATRGSASSPLQNSRAGAMETETTAIAESLRPSVSAMLTATFFARDGPRERETPAYSSQGGSQSEDRNGHAPPDWALTRETRVGGEAMDLGRRGKVRLLGCSEEPEGLPEDSPPFTSVDLSQAPEPMTCLNCSQADQSEGPDKDISLATGTEVGCVGPSTDTTPPCFCEGLCGVQTAMPVPQYGGGEPGVFGDPSDDGAAQAESFWELPRIIRHKPTSITFSDLDSPESCQSNATPTALFISESSDGGESSSGNEEDNEDANGDANGDANDDDDVFTELPRYREFLISRQRRSANRGRPKRNGPIRRQDVPPPEEEAEPRAEEAPPAVLSPWSDSMSQLMHKLDQLNLDIEEALSAGSSPSDTPTVARKQMPGAVLETALDLVQGEGCGSQNCSSSSSSSSCLRRNTRGSGSRARRTKSTDMQAPGLTCKRDGDLSETTLVKFR
ncbi:uncharacterized protein LOC133133375 [Conger conger]|uniref:uncharacterized protein LOC133133375 n=1 Tax=Conger conger TaxID=82655 RepID=UPI002A5AACDE|nr:uncharacterized protein LOC133133375 [Conger conger]